MTIRPDELAYDLSAFVSSMEPEEAATGRGPKWDQILEAAAVMMDDEIRETLHSEWDDFRSPADFLAVYCARHERKFGSRFYI